MAMNNCDRCGMQVSSETTICPNCSSVLPLIDWPRLILRGCESKELDYKEAMDWNEMDTRHKYDIIKDVLAFANTKGGWIIIGVSQRNNLFSWDGVTEEQAASFDDTRFNVFLNKCVEPPIACHIYKPEVRGNLYVVIEVPQFSESIHICQIEVEGVLRQAGIYCRDANNQSTPILHPDDMRSIMNRCVRLAVNKNLRDEQ